MSTAETVLLSAIGAVLVLGVVLGIGAWARTRRQQASLLDVGARVGAALGLEVVEPGERLSGERDQTMVQVLWHREGVHSARATTVVWAAIDPPLEIEIVISTPDRAAGPRQVLVQELGDPPVYLGGRGAGEARRWLGEHRADIRAAAEPIGSAADVQLEVDRRSAQIRFDGLVMDPPVLNDALERVFDLARIVARGIDRAVQNDGS